MLFDLCLLHFGLSSNADMPMTSFSTIFCWPAPRLRWCLKTPLLSCSKFMHVVTGPKLINIFGRDIHPNGIISTIRGHDDPIQDLPNLTCALLTTFQKWAGLRASWLCLVWCYNGMNASIRFGQWKPCQHKMQELIWTSRKSERALLLRFQDEG